MGSLRGMAANFLRPNILSLCKPDTPLCRVGSTGQLAAQQKQLVLCTRCFCCPYTFRLGLGVKFETILHSSCALVEYGFKFHTQPQGVWTSYPILHTLQSGVSTKTKTIPKFLESTLMIPNIKEHIFHQYYLKSMFSSSLLDGLYQVFFLKII